MSEEFLHLIVYMFWTTKSTK